MKLKQIIYFGVISALVIALILMTFIFIPSDSSTEIQGHVTKIYFADHISNAHQKVINRFNELYKGQIEVVGINLPFTKFSTNERKELLTRYLRSKSSRIDVFSVDQIWVPRFAKWSLPLDKFIPATQKENLLKYAMESCYYKDTLVAIPLYIDIALMYYRRDLLQNLPDYPELKRKLEESITWDDLISLKKELGEDYPFFLFQADDFEGLICIFTEMMANKGKQVFSDGELQLKTTEAKEVLQFLVDMVNKYNISPMEVTQLKENPSYDYYVNNNGVFLRGWTAFLSEESRRSFNYNKIFSHLEGVPTPHFKGSKPVSIYGGWNLMISKFSTKIPEAQKFLSFLISEEAQKILYDEGRLLPINLNVYSDSSYAVQRKELSFYYSLLQRGVHRPFTEKYTSISDVLSYYLNSAIKGEISVDEALSEATQKINSESILIK